MGPAENGPAGPDAVACWSRTLAPLTSSAVSRYDVAEGKVTLIRLRAASPVRAVPDSTTSRLPLPSATSLTTVRVSPAVSVPLTAPVGVVPVSWRVATIRSPPATPGRPTVTEADLALLVEELVLTSFTYRAGVVTAAVTVTGWVVVAVRLLASVTVTVTV